MVMLHLDMFHNFIYAVTQYIKIYNWEVKSHFKSSIQEAKTDILINYNINIFLWEWMHWRGWLWVGDWYSCTLWLLTSPLLLPTCLQMSPPSRRSSRSLCHNYFSRRVCKYLLRGRFAHGTSSPTPDWRLLYTDCTWGEPSFPAMLLSLHLESLTRNK